MQFAIAIPTDADSWRLVRRAEELGFARAWFYDTQMLSADPFVAMAAAALKTPLPTLTRGSTTVMVSLSKGLGCPVGAMRAVLPWDHPILRRRHSHPPYGWVCVSDAYSPKWLRWRCSRRRLLGCRNRRLLRWVGRAPHARRRDQDHLIRTGVPGRQSH